MTLSGNESCGYMSTPNIDYMLNLAQSYIEGTGDDLHFELDYGYELEKRYRAMTRENKELADLIFDHLVREGSDYATSEHGEVLRERIRRQYEYVISSPAYQRR